jgi:hypothetical protein
MAKRKAQNAAINKSDGGTIVAEGGPNVADAGDSSDPETMEETEAIVEVFSDLMVGLPYLVPLPSERIYCQRQVQSTLSPDEAETFKRLLITLECNGTRLADGTVIRRPSHAVRWLIEQVAVAENSSSMNSIS